MLAVWSERHQQLTAITTGISGSNGDGDANSIAPPPGEATAAATSVPATQPPTFASSDYETPFCYMRETIRVITRIRCVSGAVVSIIARWLIVKRTRAGQHPEIFCHHISAFLIGPLDQRRHSGLESHIADLVRVARTSSPGWLVPWADLIRDARPGSPSSLLLPCSSKSAPRGRHQDGIADFLGQLFLCQVSPGAFLGVVAEVAHLLQ